MSSNRFEDPFVFWKDSHGVEGKSDISKGEGKLSCKARLASKDGDSMAYHVNHLEKITEQKVVLIQQVRYLQNSLGMKRQFH